MTCHMSDTKIDSREVYEDDSIRIDCDCNADKACSECIDGGLYGVVTTTQQGKPESIALDWCIGSHQGCDCPDCYTAEQNGGR